MLQVVFVKWGQLYGVDAINRLVRSILQNTSCDVRFTCITDDLTSDYAPEVMLKPFPAFAAPFESLKTGCRLKMSMFAPGILDDGIPALFLDLDTFVRGDVAKVRDHLVAHPQIHLMKSHYIQWWPVQRWVKPVIGNKYYHANSSAVGFYPEKYHWVFDRFNQMVVGAPEEARSKTLRVDDRFISYATRDSLRVFPTSLLTKFSGEYMSPTHTCEAVRSQLPWVRSRRSNQVAITFAGADLKPDRLMKLKPGDEIRYKWLRTRWNHPEFQESWQD